MPKTLTPPAERQADDIIDAYLASQFGVGLERVLLDGIEGHVTAAVVGAVTIEACQTGRWPYADGGLAEFYAGVLTLQGVAYNFRADTYSIPGAYVHRFLTNVSEFEAIDWTARAQVCDGAKG
jgi:hypothetical protein